MTEITIRKSSNIPDGKELFEGISGNFHDFGQTLCELIDNPISNFTAHKIQGLIELTLEEHDTYVDVMIRDNGTGCAKLEEGFGLRHMRERLNMLGGTLSYGNLDSDAQDGYTGFFITVSLPIRNKKGE